MLLLNTEDPAIICMNNHNMHLLLSFCIYVLSLPSLSPSFCQANSLPQHSAQLSCLSMSPLPLFHSAAAPSKKLKYSSSHPYQNFFPLSNLPPPHSCTIPQLCPVPCASPTIFSKSLTQSFSCLLLLCPTQTHSKTVTFKSPLPLIQILPCNGIHTGRYHKCFM